MRVWKGSSGDQRILIEKNQIVTAIINKLQPLVVQINIWNTDVEVPVAGKFQSNVNVITIV
ncbi:hypothetical protein EF128_22650 [Escherichia coli]|nr:hypothetical protein [Escherichia coli]ESS96896.1 hypothetical protein L341_3426 [Escherichia coli CE418]EEX9685409.1 hypothetical protein [Escherichia coli]EFO2259627.1 hypothetical protein [Escherichia coli]EST02079.1 hypothetical protein L341_0662 [Escherichia coli CE418]